MSSIIYYLKYFLISTYSETEFLNFLFAGHSLDFSTQRSELLFEVFISSLNVNNIVYYGDSICCQTCDNKSCTCSQVGSTDSGSGQLLYTINDRGISFHLDVRTHTGKLVRVFESVFKNTLCYYAGSFCKSQSNSDLRLHICRISRIRKSFYMSTM